MPRSNRNSVYNFFPPLIAAAIGALLLLITLMALWIMFSPSTPTFEVTNVTTSANSTASFSVEGLLRNPNFGLSLAYERLDLSVWFERVTVASATLKPFSARGRTDAPVRAQLAAAHRPLPDSVAVEIEVRRRFHGSVAFGATLDAGFRYKYGVLRTKVHYFTFECYPLNVELPMNDTTMNNGRLVTPKDCYVV